MTDYNEYSDLEYKNIVTEILDDRNLRYKIRGTQLQGCCPFHDDDNPSFRYNFEKKTYNCFSCDAHGNIVDFVSELKNISKDEALELLGFPQLSTDFKYTLKDYADEKNLNIKVLKDLYHLETSNQGVMIPYYDEASRYVGARFRHSPNNNPRFTWEKGTKTTIYGIWYIERLPTKYVILVEGESDCHCAWLNNIVALGIPRCKKCKKRI